MERYRQFKPLVIADFEATEWPHPPHHHNHYELIYIWQGVGTHRIQGMDIVYTPGDIFLVGPDEEHYFIIDSATRFIFIKFTDV